MTLDGFSHGVGRLKVERVIRALMGLSVNSPDIKQPVNINITSPSAENNPHCLEMKPLESEDWGNPNEYCAVLNLMLIDEWHSRFVIRRLL